MADQRTVTLHLNSVRQTQLLEALQASHTAELLELLAAVKADPHDGDIRHQYKAAHRVNTRHEFYAALGYLSGWNMTFPTADIYPEGGNADCTDLIAVYKRDDGTVGYSIAAIWQETYYSFHS